jgi:hypothetical protein
MNMIEKTVAALEKLRSARGISILTIKMSQKTNQFFYESDAGYAIGRGKKYVNEFSGVSVYIDPYIKEDWVQIYYRTPVSSLNTVTVTEDSQHGQ